MVWGIIHDNFRVSKIGQKQFVHIAEIFETNYSISLRQPYPNKSHKAYLKHQKRQTNKQTNKHIPDGRTVGRSDGRTVGRTVGQTDGRLDGRTDGRTNGRKDDGRTDGRSKRLYVKPECVQRMRVK